MVRLLVAVHEARHGLGHRHPDGGGGVFIPGQRSSFHEARQAREIMVISRTFWGFVSAIQVSRRGLIGAGGLAGGGDGGDGGGGEAVLQRVLTRRHLARLGLGAGAFLGVLAVDLGAFWRGQWHRG